MNTVFASVDGVGAAWAASQDGSAELLHGFARGLLAFTEDPANKDIKQADIGAACARAEGRKDMTKGVVDTNTGLMVYPDKPYSPSWVSRALKAAKAFPEKPTDSATSAAFCRMFYGHDKRVAKAADPSAKDPQKNLDACVKNAIKAFEGGFSGADIIGAVTAAINAAVKARDSVPAADPNALAAAA
jgi:hypothetical protein